FVVEFKVGAAEFDRAAAEQVWDYALDLKNFHEASHSASIVPILVATGSHESAPLELLADGDLVYRPIGVRADDFRAAIDLALRSIDGAALDGQNWPNAPYRPTPTIVEAARALYAQHAVEAITCFDAGKRNLRVRSRRIEELVDDARAR